MGTESTFCFSAEKKKAALKANEHHRAFVLNCILQRCYFVCNQYIIWKNMLLKFKAIPEKLRFSWKLKEESEIIVLLFASPSGKGSTQLETTVL